MPGIASRCNLDRMYLKGNAPSNILMLSPVAVLILKIKCSGVLQPFTALSSR
jgi:hypothetical protein